MKGELEAVKKCAKKYIFNKNSIVNKNFNERLSQGSQVSNSNLSNDNELEEELNLYKKAIQENNCELLKNIKHSSEFWMSIKSESHQNYVILYELALRLAAIPSSSAAIERYFSVCGNIFKKMHRV